MIESFIRNQYHNISTFPLQLDDIMIYNSFIKENGGSCLVAITSFMEHNGGEK